MFLTKIKNSFKVFTLLFALTVGVSAVTTISAPVYAEDGDGGEGEGEDTGAFNTLVTSIANLFKKFQTFLYIAAAFALIVMVITTLKGDGIDAKKFIWFAVGLVIIAVAGLIIGSVVETDQLKTFVEKTKDNVKVVD